MARLEDCRERRFVEDVALEPNASRWPINRIVCKPHPPSVLRFGVSLRIGGFPRHETMRPLGTRRRNLRIKTGGAPSVHTSQPRT